MDRNNRDFTDITDVAEKVRTACIKAAQEGFQDASMSGLCMEGAIESAVGSIQSLNLDKIIDKQVNKRK